MANSLYVVLLGGKIQESNLIEDHSIVYVVAKDSNEAVIKAKLKSPNPGMHIDGMQKINLVDGYKINLEKTILKGDSYNMIELD